MENNPYAPSASTLHGGEAVPQPGETSFRDLGGISGKLLVLLLMGAAWHGLGLVLRLTHYSLLSPAHTAAETRANLLRAELIGVGPMILFLATAIVFGRWIYLAHKNLPELGARYLRVTPGWSVGCFFVPLLNLWAPYQAMRDLAKASRNPRQWELEDTPPLIVIWWILWLLSRFISSSVLTSLLAASSGHAVQSAGAVAYTSLVCFPLYLLACYVVRRVWRDQSQTHAQMSGSLAM